MFLFSKYTQYNLILNMPVFFLPENTFKKFIYLFSKGGAVVKIWRKKMVQIKHYFIFLLEIFACIFKKIFLIYFNWRLITL